MRRFLRNSTEEINELIILVAQKKQLPEVIVEKDLWVSYVLEYLFNRCTYKDFFEFKGGTSLSKGYNLINRFSEDVDIVLNSRVLGIDIETVLALESKNQKQKKADELNTKALEFYETGLVSLFETEMNAELNKPIHVSLNKEELAIYIEYPSSYSDGYIRNSVKLEMGPLAAWTPNEKRTVKSFIQEFYPNLFFNSEFVVLITMPKRTFWEKAVILHQEANRKEGKIPPRYSRHYYDLYRMFSSYVKNDALADIALLNEVRKFTSSFYYRSWSKFEEAVPGTFKMYPNAQYMHELENDYKRMQSMIFGNDAPNLKTVLDVIKQLEDEINSLEEK